MSIQVLAVSDHIDPRIHSSTIRERMTDVQLVIGCGDVPARYLEFLADALDKPVYFVFGNHLEEMARRATGGKQLQPMGCVDLGGKVYRDEWTGLILAGIPGSPRYADGEEHQYTELQVRWMMLRMWPRLYWNRWRHGRALDVLVTHAPPRDIGDRADPPHRGFVALRHFIARFQPRVHLHGHIHLYDRNEPSEHAFHETRIINVYPYKVLAIPRADGMVTPSPPPARSPEDPS